MTKITVTSAKRRNDGFVDFVLDQLRGLRGVTARGMFGGHGLYKDGVFFGGVLKGQVFFRVSDQTRPDYVIRGMKPFAPYQMKPMRSLYEVPSDILESPPQLQEWASAAIRAAVQAKVRKAARPRKKTFSR